MVQKLNVLECVCVWCVHRYMDITEEAGEQGHQATADMEHKTPGQNGLLMLRKWQLL